jgi:hypothetical protein
MITRTEHTTVTIAGDIDIDGTAVTARFASETRTLAVESRDPLLIEGLTDIRRLAAFLTEFADAVEAERQKKETAR